MSDLLSASGAGRSGITLVKIFFLKVCYLIFHLEYHFSLYVVSRELEVSLFVRLQLHPTVHLLYLLFLFYSIIDIILILICFLYVSLLAFHFPLVLPLFQSLCLFSRLLFLSSVSSKHPKLSPSLWRPRLITSHSVQGARDIVVINNADRPG